MGSLFRFRYSLTQALEVIETEVTQEAVEKDHNTDAGGSAPDRRPRRPIYLISSAAKSPR
jgi:hypothetical protein